MMEWHPSQKCQDSGVRGREDCAVSLNPSEAQWCHLLHLWKKIQAQFKSFYTLPNAQSGSL